MTIRTTKQQKQLKNNKNTKKQQWQQQQPWNVVLASLAHDPASMVDHHGGVPKNLNQQSFDEWSTYERIKAHKAPISCSINMMI